MRLILSALVTITGVWAIPKSQPVQTSSAENQLDGHGISPRPTEGPSLELFRKRAEVVGLQKRSTSFSSGQLVGYFAPDSACGYISGNVGAEISCAPQSRCAAIAPIGNMTGAMGCCSSDCAFIAGCYNLADVQASKCDNGCQRNSDITLCTQSSAPFCYGYTWPDISATIWGCASATASTKDTVLFTFNGENDSRSWSAYHYTPSASSNGLIRPSSSSSSSSTPTPTAPPAGHSSNAGAIAGGVVGGVAVLAALAFGIFFLLHRSRQRKRAAAAAANNTGATGPAGGAMYGGGAEAKPDMVGSPATSADVAYAKVAPNSPYSDSSQPVPPYTDPGHPHPHEQGALLEMDATPQVFEAPAGIPGERP